MYLKGKSIQRPRNLIGHPVQLFCNYHPLNNQVVLGLKVPKLLSLQAETIQLGHAARVPVPSVCFFTGNSDTVPHSFLCCRQVAEKCAY
jgi:hypothetical protein